MIAVPCRWERPNANEILLNVDGAVNDTSFGFGGLLRKNSGEPLLYYIGSEGSNSVLEQELRGIKVGLVAARTLGIYSIAIVSDSQLVVNIIARKETAPWRLKNIFCNIKLICNAFCKWGTYHCPRETNKPTDLLAKKARL